MSSPWTMPDAFMQEADVLVYPNWASSDTLVVDIVPAGLTSPASRKPPYETESPMTHYGYAQDCAPIPMAGPWDRYKLGQGTRRFKILKIEDYDGFVVFNLEEEKNASA